MALQEVLNSSIWVIKDDKSNYQPLYGQFLYTLNTDASGDDDKGVLYVGNGTEWINVMGTALLDVVENILATVPFEQIDNKTIFDAINEKANKATTLEGYGIEDAYTKTTIDAIILALEAELAGKQDKLTAGDNISIDGNKISVTGLTKASVGLDQVDNTSDANKPISTATQEALDAKQDIANLVTSFGVTPSDTKYPSEKLVNDVLNQTNQRITGVENDTQALSTNKQDKLTAGTNITISETNEISVTGLTKASVGLDKVDNTSDAEKPISTATQTALDLKADKTQVANISTNGTVTTVSGSLHVEELDTGETGSILTGTLVAHGQVDVPSITVGTSGVINSIATSVSSTSTDSEIPTAKATYTFTKNAISSLETIVAGKQDKLTAGTNITITGNTISATDTTYTAGTNISISDTNAISVTGLTKASVGLDQVDNTSDANKPISTATQTALDAKADKSQIANISTDGNTTKIQGNLEVSEVDTGEMGSIMTGTLVAHGQVDVDSISVGASSPLDSVSTNISSESKDTDIPTAKATYTFVKNAVGSLETIVGNKQNKTDNNLSTTDKTIVGAINEIAGNLGDKQDKLTAGDGISIENNVISATGGGSGTVKSVNNVGPDGNGNVSITTANIPNLGISEDGTTITIGDKTIIPLTASSSIAANKVVGSVAEATKATQDGNGDVISATYAKTAELSNKQDKLTAGTNIAINETNEISVTGLTKASVGLGKVDNTSDAEKPISTATQTALDAKQDISNLVTEFGETTSDTKYPSEKLVHTKISQIATDFNQQLSSKADANANNITETYVASWKSKLGVSDLESSVSNKQDILTAGDNISIDGNKISVTGVYTSTQVDGLLANKANKSTTLAGYGITDANISDGTITLGENSITPLTANSTIPADKITGLTKASVGLDQVDNTSDTDKPISNATQTALDAKQDVANLVTSFGETPSDTKYPSEKLVNDALSQTNQRITGVENDTQALSTNKQDKLTAGTNITITGTTISAKDTTYTAGTNIAISDTNAISVTGLTKASVGLGNVDNTSDASKPISTATQIALDAKQNKLTAGDNITLTGDTISATDTTYTAGTNISISDDNAISVTGLTKASVGLGNVDNTSDANKPISNATQSALNAKQDTLTSGDNISIDGNKISVTGVYTSTQVDGLLANKANNSTTLAGYGITDANISDGTITLGENSITPLTANSTIPADKITGLTKASVGLGNVDNTSDANKPISTATQAALDTKQGKLTAGDNVTISDTNVISSKDTTYTAGTNITISEANAISVTGLTKASVGLGNVDNTSDANKPISTATQAALNAKQDIANLVTTIDGTSDDTHYPSAKAVYKYTASVTSTTETTVTPTTAQTATAIAGALAKKARVVIVPSLANVGAVYIKESDTYSSINPIYPDPTNNVYEFVNMQNVKVFVDSVGDSADLVIEYRG